MSLFIANYNLPLENRAHGTGQPETEWIQSYFVRQNKYCMRSYITVPDHQIFQCLDDISPMFIYKVQV